MRVFADGLLAGFAIAVPVGAIAILILETALRRGFAEGFAAGAGAATVDLLYASLAGLAGQVLAPLLAPVAPTLRVASGLVLIGLGAWGLWRVLAAARTAAGAPASPAALLPGGWLRTYGQFVGLTLLNPMTVTYFAVLMLGQNARAPLLGPDRVWFVAGVAAASFSWQTFLAWLGALAHRRLSPRVQFWTSVLGNSVVALLGARLLLPA